MLNIPPLEHANTVDRSVGWNRSKLGPLLNGILANGLIPIRESNTLTNGSNAGRSGRPPYPDVAIRFPDDSSAANPYGNIFDDDNVPETETCA